MNLVVKKNWIIWIKNCDFNIWYVINIRTDAVLSGHVLGRRSLALLDAHIRNSKRRHLHVVGAVLSQRSIFVGTRQRKIIERQFILLMSINHKYIQINRYVRNINSCAYFLTIHLSNEICRSIKLIKFIKLARQWFIAAIFIMLRVRFVSLFIGSSTCKCRYNERFL